MTVRIQTGGVLPIAILAVTKSGAPLTGATDLFIRVFRRSDNFFIDWADNTFKASGHTTINQILAEVDATNAAGVYEFAGDWDTSTIVSPVADDSYVIYPLQTPGTNAVLPGPADVLTGEFVDDIDAAITSRSTQADILSDATPFAGANVDAAISSRSSQASQDLLLDAIVANDLVVGAGSSTTEVRTGATQATGFYDDMMLVVINTAGTVARVVSAYNNTNGAFTVATLPFTPAASDRAIVIALDQAAAGGAPSVGAIADAVWDEDVVAAHGTSDTGGLLLRALGTLI